MPPTTFNQFSDQIENYKGHVEILDGSTWFKYDSIINWSVFTRTETEKHYSSNGAKKKTITGDSSTYDLHIKRSADLYDTNAVPTEVKSISYFKSQIYGTPRVLPIISLRGVSQSNATSDSFVIDEFTATVEEIDESRAETLGVEEVRMSGEILTHTSNERQTVAP